MSPIAFLRLSRGFFALVSPEDYEAAAAHTWSVRERPRGTAYAGTRIRMEDGQRRNVELHQFVWARMGLPKPPIVDHRNGYGLDCRRENLRAASHAQNARNTAKHRDSGAPFKGITRKGAKWEARICVDGKRVSLGRFASAEQAAGAYARAAEQFSGEFARAA